MPVTDNERRDQTAIPWHCAHFEITVQPSRETEKSWRVADRLSRVPNEDPDLHSPSLQNFLAQGFGQAGVIEQYRIQTVADDLQCCRRSLYQLLERSHSLVPGLNCYR